MTDFKHGGIMPDSHRELFRQTFQPDPGLIPKNPEPVVPEEHWPEEHWPEEHWHVETRQVMTVQIEVAKIWVDDNGVTWAQGELPAEHERFAR